MTTTDTQQPIVGEEVDYSDLDIKGFIDEQFDILRTGVTDIKHTSSTLKNLGFSSCANVKYTDFLQSFEGRKSIVEKYAESYPSSIYLPWAALQKVVTSLKLRVDRADRYVGAVPEAQLPYLEMFELLDEDTPTHKDFVEALKIRSYKDPENFLEQYKTTTTTSNSGYYATVGEATRELLHKPEDIIKKIEMYHTYQDSTDLDMQYGLREVLVRRFRNEKVLEEFITTVNDIYKNDFANNYYVVAPPTAFNSEQSWANRSLGKIVTKVVDKIIETTPPPDPLVIKPCNEGVLVVAAWGDEASTLNKLVAELNI